MTVPTTSDLAGYQVYWDRAITKLVGIEVVLLVAFCVYLYILKRYL